MQIRITTLALVGLSFLTSQVHAIDLYEPGAVLAVVNGEKITGSRMNLLLSQMGPQAKEINADDQKLVKRQALDILIDEMLMRQYLNRYVSAPEPAEIEKQIVDLKEGLKKSGKSYDEFLKSTKQSDAQVRRSLANVLQWTAYGKKYVSDAHLKQYYTKYKDFFDRVVVRASHIVIQAPPGVTKEQIAKIQKKLMAIRADILAEKITFEDAVKAHSQCPSVKHGGDIGTFPRKFVVDDEFARVAFSLKVGEISNVVKTDFGYHLIKLTERKPGTPSDFTKIKEDVREIYLEDHRIELINKLRQTTKIDIRID